jgi:Kef-type K+ transport system membrane component KefB
MKLKHLFSINIFFAVFFGVTCAFFAGWALKLYGLPPEVGTLWTTRLAGGSILGFASLMWHGRRTDSQKARRAVALALLIQDLVGFAASLMIALSGSVNARAWSTSILYALLALGYAYFLFIKPERS